MADDNNEPSNKEIVDLMQTICKRLDPIDSINDRLSFIEKRLDKIDLLEQRLSGMEKELNKMRISLEDRTKYTNKRVAWLEDRVESSDMRIRLLSTRIAELERQLGEVRHDVTSQSMRNNLIFTNLPEDNSSGNEAAEVTERKLRHHLISVLNFAAESAESIRFKRVHRTPDQLCNDGKIRHI